LRGRQRGAAGLHRIAAGQIPATDRASLTHLGHPGFTDALSWIEEVFSLWLPGLDFVEDGWIVTK
jgi:hypothetical protein